MTPRNAALGELCDVQIGRTPSRAKREFWENGTHPWVSIGDITRSDKIATTKERITDAGAAVFSRAKVPAQTVLMSFKLSIGKLAISQVPVYTNEAIAALPISNTKKLDTSYLFRALEYIDFGDAGNRAAMGNTLNKQALLDITIPLPPLDEQRRIAAILDKADALRRKRKRALDLLDSLTQSIFLELFGSSVSNPKGWPERQFGDLVTNVSNKRVPLKSEDRERRPGIYPYYGASGIIDNIDDYIFSGRHLLIAEDGANLISRSSPVSFFADGKFWVNNHAHVVAENSTCKLVFLRSFVQGIDLFPSCDRICAA